MNFRSKILNTMKAVGICLVNNGYPGDGFLSMGARTGAIKLAIAST